VQRCLRGLLLATLFLIPLESAQAGVFEACRTAISSMLGLSRDARDKDPLFQGTHPFRESLQQVIDENRRDLRGVALVDDLLWITATTRLTESEFREVFRYGDRWITPDELGLRLRALGASQSMYSFEDLLSGEYGRWISARRPTEKELQAAFDRLLDKFREVKTWTPAKRQKVEAELARRQSMVRIDDYFEDPKFFSAAVENDKIRFPDGAIYRVLRREASGDLVVGVPYQNLVRTQDYLNPTIVADYVGDPSLKKIVFEGEFFPDGRVMIMDQHHRTVAYAQKYSKELPFRLKLHSRNAQGDPEYVTSPHLRLLKFLTLWGGLGEEQRAVLLTHIDRHPQGDTQDAVAPMRELYYSMTRFRRLEGEAFPNSQASQ
jgi:hypothetical protein